MSRKNHTLKPLAGDTTPLLHERLHGLYRHLPGGIAGDEEDLHEMRVASRRLRVALPLLAKSPAGKRVKRARKRLRELVRAGGRGRDLDVMLALLEQQIAQGEPREGLLRLRRSLRGSHTRSRGATAAALMDVDIAGLRRDLRRMADRGGDSVFAALARVREQRDALGGELLDIVADLGVRFDPERLHLLRRRLRRLRYTAEVQVELQGRRTQAPQQLKRLQSVLGELNDTRVFAAWLEQRGAAARRRGDLQMATEARRQRLQALQRAREGHRAWLALEPAAALRRALQAMGSHPPLAGPSAPEVGHDLHRGGA